MPDQICLRGFSLIALLGLSSCGGGEDTVLTPGPNPNSGLDRRPANSSCLAPSRSGAAGIVATRVFPALSFASPVGLLQAPGDATRWFVLEQGGVIRRFASSDSTATSAVFVDLHDRVTFNGEAGLLGLAFHPQFPTDPRAFVFYSTGGSPLVTHISEFRSGDAGLTLDPASERILITVNKPETNHNGGQLAFGPDGFLYAGVGDGGGGGDGHGAIGNGQSLATLLGKVLRIDVNATPPAGRRYAIPAANAFAGGQFCSDGGTTASGNCAEIYAYGFRNPWRFSFDRQGGTLWVGDVGQNSWEEVNRVVSGGNYGWRCREGAHAFNGNCGGATGLIDPVAEYARTAGFSVSGGYVYRGSANPLLAGRYVFGDFGSGRVWNIAADAAPTVTVSAGSDTGLSIASFAEGVDGELYAVNYGGTLHRLAQAAAGTGVDVPAQLSQTGCVSANAPATPVPGLIPYAPNAAFWSDGAVKERFLALPDGQNIVVNADGDFDFPNGSVLVKHFRIGAQLVETRLFMRHPDGVWAGYSYEWNAAGSGATRVVGGKTTTVAGQSWTFPSEAQCLQCHTNAAGHTLGLSIDQLNGTLTYAATGRSANQVTTLDAIRTLSPPFPQDPATLPRLPDPAGSTGTLSERARSYLHVNCSNCHRPGGGTPDSMDLRYATALPLTNACNAAPAAGDLGIAGARLLMPGSAAQSLIVARMNRRSTGAMPPLSSNVVDAAGVNLVSDWVNSLTTCN